MCALILNSACTFPNSSPGTRPKHCRGYLFILFTIMSDIELISWQKPTTTQKPKHLLGTLCNILSVGHLRYFVCQKIQQQFGENENHPSLSSIVYFPCGDYSVYGALLSLQLQDITFLYIKSIYTNMAWMKNNNLMYTPNRT